MKIIKPWDVYFINEFAIVWDKYYVLNFHVFHVFMLHGDRFHAADSMTMTFMRGT